MNYQNERTVERSLQEPEATRRNWECPSPVLLRLGSGYWERWLRSLQFAETVGSCPRSSLRLPVTAVLYCALNLSVVILQQRLIISELTRPKTALHSRCSAHVEAVASGPVCSGHSLLMCRSAPCWINQPTSLRARWPGCGQVITTSPCIYFRLTLLQW